MLRGLPMKRHEIAPIESQNCAPNSGSEFQDGFIGNPPIGLTGLVRGKHIMPVVAQFPHHSHVEVLIRV
jgi:hypothetical protein